MDYLDFEVEIDVGRGRIYPVRVVRSPSGEAHETMHFPFDELALENQLLTLQNALLLSGGKHRQMLLPEEQSVQKFGRVLFNALFTGEVGKRYVVSLEKAFNQGRGLRLKLCIRAPGLAALPWEFLYDSNGFEYMCLSSMTPIVRYLELAQPPKPLLMTPPLSILGIISSPKDLPELDIESEKQRLEKATENLRANYLVKLTWLPGQTWNHLQRAMRQGPWHILHFIGHGGFDSRANEGLIALEDEEGKSRELSATQLGRLLADHSSLRLVVLNACEGAKGSEHNIFSSTATILVRRGIPAVLAMQYAITDRAAIELSQAFYEALADGFPVDMAVSEARKAVSLGIANTLEWGIPVLYTHSPDGVLFEMKQQPSISLEPADRPAIEQVPALHAVAPDETPQSKLMQDEMSLRIADEVPNQMKQSVGEILPTVPASSQIDSSPPPPQPSTSPLQMTSSAEKQVPSPSMDKGNGDKADSASKVQAEEPSLVIPISPTKAEEFTWIRTLIGHASGVNSVAISPDGQTIVSGGGKILSDGDNLIRVWNLHTGELLHTLTGHTSSVNSVAISPDGQTIVSGGDDKLIRVWNLHTGELLHTLENKGLSNSVKSLAISPDGQIIVAGLYKIVNVWNLRTRTLLHTLSRAANSSWLSGGVDSVAISPDGQIIISGSVDKTIKVWNLHIGEVIRTLTGHTSSVSSVAISPDGQTIVSGGRGGFFNSDNLIRVWNPHTGELLRTLTGHTSGVNSVAISPDGQTIVSGGDDNLIRVWNLHTGELLYTLTDHTSCVKRVAISPDGQTIVSGGGMILSDGYSTIRVWSKK